MAPPSFNRILTYPRLPLPTIILMPRYTEDFSPFRALLGAPYPLPIYIARRVYPRRPGAQPHAPQQPTRTALTVAVSHPPPPPPGPPPPIPLPPCPPNPPAPPYPPTPPDDTRATSYSDPEAAAAQAQGFPYNPTWRERPPAAGPIPYPARTPEQEAQSAARNEIRLELRRYRRIAATAGRVRLNAADDARDVVDAMAPVRNMQAVRRMQNMLNLSAPPTARRGRAISAPTTPTQARAIEETPSFTSSTNNPFVTAASNKITPLRSAAVIIPREPNLSDLTSYYPRADPFSDAIADPHGGFRHWSNGELATGSPWNTPQRDRRGSGQSGVSPSSTQPNPFTPQAQQHPSTHSPSPSSSHAIDNDLDLGLTLSGPSGKTSAGDLELTPDEALAVKAITALVNTQIEQTASETIIRIPRSYHTRARMLAEQYGAAPNPIPPTSPAAGAAGPSSASAASIQTGGMSPDATELNNPRVRIGFDPDVNSYVAVYDNHTLLISPATHNRLREVLGLEAGILSTDMDEPQYSPMAIDPRTADAMGQSTSGLSVQNATHATQQTSKPAFGGGTANGFPSASARGQASPQPDHPGQNGLRAQGEHAASWPRPLPARETGAFEPAPTAGMHLLGASAQRHFQSQQALGQPLGQPHRSLSLAPLPPPMTASGLVTRPTYSTPVNGLSRGLTLPSAPASRPPPFMPAAKACHNALLALRIADWRKGAVTSHNYRLLGNALREGRRIQYAPDGEGWSADQVRGYLDGREEDGDFLGSALTGQAQQGAAAASEIHEDRSVAQGQVGSQAFASVDGHGHDHAPHLDNPAAPIRSTKSNKRARQDSPTAGAPIPGTSAPRPIAEVMRPASTTPDQGGADAEVRPALKRLRPRNRR